MQSTGDNSPLLKKIYSKIMGFLKFKWFFVATLLGLITSWLIKGDITPLLLGGKSFDGRSLLYQIVILVIYVFFTSVILFCSLMIVSLLFARQLNWGLKKLHVVFMNLQLPSMQLFHKMVTSSIKVFTNLKLLGIQLLRKIWAGLKCLYKEAKYTLQLFTIKRENVRSYLSSSYRIVLIILFSILFLPHVFVVVQDINFVTAYEVDPGSIISSILSLFQHSYNMNAEYHSSLYGWTYYSINYFLLMPVYLAKTLKIVTDDYYLFVGIRFIFFMIGLASALVYFEVAKRTLRQNFLSFLAVILYIASPVVFFFFYFIHPETTGLLFLFVSILCLIHYNEGLAKDHRWYTLGLLSLVLSVLSKQVFFFTAPPVMFLYIYFYCHHHNKSFFRFLISKQFLKALFASVVFSIFIFFIINPFAFFQPKVFITNQIAIFSDQTQGTLSTLTHIEAIEAWIKIIKTTPIIYISILASPFTILGAVIFGRDQKTGKMFYIVNIISAVVFIMIYSFSARLNISKTYFAPIYPFFVLNLLAIPLYIVRTWNFSLVKFLTITLLVYFLSFIVVDNFSVSLPKGYARLMYKNTLIYKVYTYIEESVPNDSRIAYDLFVAIPSGKGITACQFWKGCGTDYIEEFQPDYVIFNMNYTYNDDIHPPTARLIKYVNDHHFILIDTIESVSVWKKPP